MSRLRIGACLAAACVAGSVLAEQRLTVVVMDPLCDRLACACVKGYAQRNYEALGKYLAAKLHQPVKVVYAEDLARALDMPSTGKVDLIIGKSSVVKFDAAECGMKIRPIASLTGQDGSTTLTGLFVVRSNDRAKTLADLKGRRIFFGSPDADEKSRGAFEALHAIGIAVPKKVKTFEGCSDAALAVLDSKERPAPAGLISSYAAALIYGCGTVPKGSLKIVGRTAPFPFVTAFATGNADEVTAKRIQAALTGMREDPKMLKVMESKYGFVDANPPAKPVSADWPGWRGSHRDGSVPWLPRKLPPRPRVVWSQSLTNSGLAGVSVSDGYIVVADRDAKDQNDIFRCFRAEDGRPIWKLVDLSPGRLDYGASARATPMIYAGLAYLLGAMGHLKCVDLATGKLVWSRRLVEDFSAVRPQWGYASSPLVVGNKLIVNPGAPGASLVALDRQTGAIIWQIPGGAAAYASFILAKLGGKNQIVGYDQTSLGGWDPATGTRLWTLTPPNAGDFNVSSPNVFNGQLVVSTENNGTRMYAFDQDGKIVPKPVSSFAALSPDTVTPVVVGRHLVGCSGVLYCLDLATNMKLSWSAAGECFQEYTSLFTSGERVMLSTFRGELLLFEPGSSKPHLIDRIRLRDGDTGSYSHPALVGSHLYVRESTRVTCFELQN